MTEEPEDPTVSKSEKSDSKRARESTKGEHKPQEHTLPTWLTSRTWQANLLLVVIGLVIVSLLVLLLLQPASAASKQVINLIQIIISWPIVIVLALLLLYKPISRFLESLGRNFQTVKISVLQFALEVSRPLAKEFTPDWLDTFSGLDIRLTTADDMISSMPSLFEQFKGNEVLDYALIDIGDGKKWLTSRLYIFAIMLERMRGLRRLVFVQTTPDAYQRFLGTASPSEVRWKLAMLYPWLEPAFAQALYLVQYFPNVLDPPQLLQVQVPRPLPTSPSSIRSVHGAVDTFVAKSIVRAFLKDPSIQLESQPAQNDTHWEEITRLNKLPFWEHADWIDRAWIYKQGDIINRKTFRKSSPNDSPTEQTKVILKGNGTFIALVDEEKQFEDLVDRYNLLERVVANLSKELDDDKP